MRSLYESIMDDDSSVISQVEQEIVPAEIADRFFKIFGRLEPLNKTVAFTFESVAGKLSVDYSMNAYAYDRVLLKKIRELNKLIKKEIPNVKCKIKTEKHNLISEHWNIHTTIIEVFGEKYYECYTICFTFSFNSRNGSINFVRVSSASDELLKYLKQS